MTSSPLGTATPQAPPRPAPEGEVALHVTNLGKRYRMGENAHVHTLFAERLNAGVKRLLRPETTRLSSDDATFWALRDVSFEVRFGEVMGIIGPNGAGKSTLLKLLSRISAPTEGRVVARGRIATLLEVGTGFHPELTGRENVYLNGSLLGMRRREIARKFDEIVEFSGVARFLDTPVKRYSSGMYVRLAFAVAAHLDPEVLLLDEVLSVGDAEFQRKCLGKMRDVTGEGRAVVFVSHGMGTVQAVCDRVALLEKGRIRRMGDPESVIAAYLDENMPQVERSVEGRLALPDDFPRVGSGQARLRASTIDMPYVDGQYQTRFRDPVRLEFEIEVFEEIHDVVLEVGVASFDGQRVATAHSTDRVRPRLTLAPGAHRVDVQIDAALMPGEYAVDFAVHDGSVIGREKTLDAVARVGRFHVVNGAVDGDEYPWFNVRGHWRPETTWFLDDTEIGDDRRTDTWS
jgi:lipopolysaccharide transport system ATP-binding protein